MEVRESYGSGMVEVRWKGEVERVAREERSKALYLREVGGRVGRKAKGETDGSVERD